MLNSSQLLKKFINIRAMDISVNSYRGVNYTHLKCKYFFQIISFYYENESYVNFFLLIIFFLNYWKLYFVTNNSFLSYLLIMKRFCDFDYKFMHQS